MSAKKILWIAIVIAVALPFLFKGRSKISVRLVGNGPDVVYRILVEGIEVAKIRKGERVDLEIRSGDRAIEVAIGDIVLRSQKITRNVVFDLPPLQNPKVDYEFSKGSLVINRVYDEGPYPVEWKVNGRNDFPMRIDLPATPILEGYLEGKKVFSEELSLSKISHVDITYDGKMLKLNLKMDGFFEPTAYEINSLKFSTTDIPVETLPSSLDVKPLYSDFEWDGVEVNIPDIPELDFDGSEVTLKREGFLLNGTQVSAGSYNLPDGTSEVDWVYEGADFTFKRIWTFFVDRTPPQIDVRWNFDGSSLVVDITSNEWSYFSLECGPVILRDEGTSVSFRIRKVLSDTITVIATDRSGNEVRKQFKIGEVGE